MSPADWTRVKRLAAAAWEEPERERERYVIEQCGEDGQLRGEVLLLLQSMAEASDRFETPVPGVEVGFRDGNGEPPFAPAGASAPGRFCSSLVKAGWGRSTWPSVPARNSSSAPR